MGVRLRKEKNNRVCFTLVELVIVVVIIAILAAAGVSYYQRTTVKAKAGKAQNAISLIIEAEKIFRIDNGVYVNFTYGQANAAVGTARTGMNLRAVDSDRDFRYRVTGADLIRARPRRPIGTCPAANAGEIRYRLSTEAWTVPACYR